MNEIAKAMLHYRPCPKLERLQSKPDFSSWGLSDSSVKLLEKNANAFFIAALFDYLVVAENAWETPLELKKRLGHLDVEKISKTHPAILEAVIRGNEQERSLHRFPAKMAVRTISMANKLITDYSGNAANIWKQGSPNAKEVLDRLNSFDGIGQKLSSMIMRILVTYYGVKLTGWENIDIAVDRHVARVFLRTGLIKIKSKNKLVKLAEIKADIINRARQLSPKFPGALDEPAFLIGRTWCTADQAHCEVDSEDEDGPCPLNKCCPRQIQFGVL